MAVVTVYPQPYSLPGEAQVQAASLNAAMVHLPFSTVGHLEMGAVSLRSRPRYIQVGALTLLLMGSLEKLRQE